MLMKLRREVTKPFQNFVEEGVRYNCLHGKCRFLFCFLHIGTVLVWFWGGGLFSDSPSQAQYMNL